MYPLESVFVSSSYGDPAFDFGAIQSDFSGNDTAHSINSQENSSLWGRVTADWYSLLVGLCVVIAVSGVAYSILSGAPLAGIGYGLLGVVTLYQYYCMLDYSILQSAVEALEISRKNFAQSCFDLKHTTSRLEATNKNLHMETETLKGINLDLMRTEEGLRERTDELGRALVTQQEITGTLTSQVDRLEDKIYRMEHLDETYRETAEKLSRTQQEFDRVAEMLRKSEERLTITTELLEKQILRITAENSRLSRIGDRLEELTTSSS